MKIHSHEFCSYLLGWRLPMLATIDSFYSSDSRGSAGASCVLASPASPPGSLSPSTESAGVEFSWEMSTVASGWSSLTWLELTSSFPSNKKKNIFVAVLCQAVWQCYSINHGLYMGQSITFIIIVLIDCINQEWPWEEGLSTCSKRHDGDNSSGSKSTTLY